MHILNSLVRLCRQFVGKITHNIRCVYRAVVTCIYIGFKTCTFHPTSIESYLEWDIADDVEMLYFVDKDKRCWKTFATKDG